MRRFNEKSSNECSNKTLEKFLNCPKVDEFLFRCLDKNNVDCSFGKFLRSIRNEDSDFWDYNSIYDDDSAPKFNVNTFFYNTRFTGKEIMYLRRKRFVIYRQLLQRFRLYKSFNEETEEFENDSDKVIDFIISYEASRSRFKKNQ